MRLAPLGALAGAALSFADSVGISTNPGTPGTPFTPGMWIAAGMADGLDLTSNVANWGTCELLYVRYASATVINPGRLVTLDKNFTIADLANTANLSQDVYVTLSRFTDGSTTPQFGWVLGSGIAPVQFAVAATAGVVYIGGAGQATPTQANGKQLLGMRTLIAAASTFTRPVQTVNGSSQVRVVGGTGGMYRGQAISGTGIPASSVISDIDPSGQFITIGSAIATAVAATATGQVTATMTNTGYGICQFNRPKAQGQTS